MCMYWCIVGAVYDMHLAQYTQNINDLFELDTLRWALMCKKISIVSAFVLCIPLQFK